MEVKTSGHDLLCNKSSRLERQSVSCNRQGRSCWSRWELLVTMSSLACMPGRREEEPGVTGGQRDVTNMQTGSRRSQGEEEGPLLAEEDLSIQWSLWEVLRIWREKKKEIHHHKRRERISPVYRKPPGECKHVALATHSKAWQQEPLPVISMLSETQLTQKTCTKSK